MLFVAVPNALRSNTQLMHNLLSNSRQLLTHYDIFTTLYDISINNDWEKFDKRNFAGIMSTDRGESLIRPFVRPHRNCKTLEITEQYCLCEQQYLPIAVNSSMAQQLAETIVTYINNLVSVYLRDNMKSQHLCEKLKLSSVIDAQVPIDGSQLTVIVLETIPGYGIFEGRIQNTMDYNYFDREDHDFDDLESKVRFVSRLNSYGHDADCTPRSTIAPYCYCMLAK